MKKLIVILCMFALVVAGAVWETVFTTRFYCDMESQLIKVQNSIKENFGDLANEDTVAAMNECRSVWEKDKYCLFLIGHHSIVQTLDDKIVSLCEIVRTNNSNDAVIYVASAINYVQNIAKDSFPLPHILF